MSTLSERISTLAEKAILERVFPGCVVGAILANGERILVAKGTETYDQNSPQVTEQAVFDVASVTKVVPTGLLAAKLLHEGSFTLDTPVVSIVPELRMPDAEKILVRHLFTYTASNPAFGENKHGPYEQLREAIFTTPLGAPPGEKFLYTNLPSYLLGLIIERKTGKQLDIVADELLFTPLGLRTITFHPRTLPASTQIIPTEVTLERGEVRGVVHDESAHLMQQHGEIPGHAGLFSTADDLLTVLEMLLSGGILNGARILEKEVVDRIFANHTKGMAESVGLSWALNVPSLMGDSCTECTAGKSGFTGTFVAIDRSLDVAWVVLSNRTYPERGSADAITRFRNAVGELILASAR